MGGRHIFRVLEWNVWHIGLDVFTAFVAWLDCWRSDLDDPVEVLDRERTHAIYANLCIYMEGRW